jgi:hypothetical protein
MSKEISQAEYYKMSMKELNARLRKLGTAATDPSSLFQTPEQEFPTTETSGTGELLGGTAGSLLAMGKGDIAQTGLAGLLGGAGDYLEQATKTGGYPPPPFAGEIPLPGRLPETPPDLAQSGRAAKRMAAAELMGSGVTRLTKKIISPMANKFIDDFDDIVKWGKEYGVQFPPAALTKSWWQQLKHTAAEQGFGSAEGMEEFYKKKIWDPIKGGFKQIRKDIGEYKAPEVRAQNFESTWNAAEGLHSRAAAEKYAGVDKIWKEPIVDTGTLKQLAQEGIDNPTIFGSRKYIPRLKEILNLPRKITFGQAHKERSELLGISRLAKMGESKSVKTTRARIQAIFNDAMDEAGKNIQNAPNTRVGPMGRVDDVTTFDNPLLKMSKKQLSFEPMTLKTTKKVDPRKAYQAYREAADFYKEGADAYQDLFIMGKINNKLDAQTAAQLIPDKSPDVVNRLKKGLHENNWTPKEYKAVWDEIRASWFEDMLEKRGLEVATEDTIKMGVEREVIPANPSNIIARIDDAGETFTAMFSEAERKTIGRGLQVLRALDKQSKRSRTGKIFFAMKQASAVGGLPGGGVQILQGRVGAGTGLVASGLTILMTPRFFYKMLSNETYTKLLTNTLTKDYATALKMVDQMNRLSARITAQESELPWGLTEFTGILEKPYQEPNQQ